MSFLIKFKLGHGGKVYKHVEFNITSPSPQAKNFCYRYDVWSILPNL
ncbi:hypothetical protein IC582_001798 [Cucumis melo]